MTVGKVPMLKLKLLIVFLALYVVGVYGHYHRRRWQYKKYSHPRYRSKYRYKQKERYQRYQQPYRKKYSKYQIIQDQNSQEPYRHKKYYKISQIDQQFGTQSTDYTKNKLRKQTTDRNKNKDKSKNQRNQKKRANRDKKKKQKQVVEEEENMEQQQQILEEPEEQIQQDNEQEILVQQYQQQIIEQQEQQPDPVSLQIEQQRYREYIPPQPIKKPKVAEKKIEPKKLEFEPMQIQSIQPIIQVIEAVKANTQVFHSTSTSATTTPSIETVLEDNGKKVQKQRIITPLPVETAEPIKPIQPTEKSEPQSQAPSSSAEKSSPPTAPSVSPPIKPVKTQPDINQCLQKAVYDYNLLVLTWIPVNCYGDQQCQKDWLSYQDFKSPTIHGYRPYGSSSYYQNCFGEYEDFHCTTNSYMSNFDIDQALWNITGLLYEISQYWPALKFTHDQQSFYEEQWRLHGSCYLMNMIEDNPNAYKYDRASFNRTIMVQYFRTTISKFKQLAIKVQPGREYNYKEDFAGDIGFKGKQTHFVLSCDQNNEVNQITFCFNRSKLPGKQVTIPCTLADSCDQERKFKFKEPK